MTALSMWYLPYLYLPYLPNIETHTGHVFLDGSSKCANTNIETHTGHVFLDGSSKCANTNIETHTGLNAPTLT